MRRLLVSVAILIGGPTLLHAACPGRLREHYEPRTFLGYACEDDCERHKAGFAWAVEHRVSEREACAALQAFEAEGCRAYVEERLSPEQAGDRWALENEIVDPCLCEGGGDGFRAGCLGLATGAWAAAPAASKRGRGRSRRFRAGAATGKLPR